MKILANISVNKVLKTVGVLLIAAGIFLIYYPLLKQEITYQKQQFFKSKNQEKEDKEIIPIDKDFGLVIPKIEVNAKVFANVDAQNPKEYLPLLVKGVAQAKGSFLPGQEGNVLGTEETSMSAETLVLPVVDEQAIKEGEQKERELGGAGSTEAEEEMSKDNFVQNISQEVKRLGWIRSIGIVVIIFGIIFLIIAILRKNRQ